MKSHTSSRHDQRDSCVVRDRPTVVDCWVPTPGFGLCGMVDRLGLSLSRAEWKKAPYWLTLADSYLAPSRHLPLIARHRNYGCFGPKRHRTLSIGKSWAAIVCEDEDDEAYECGSLLATMQGSRYGGLGRYVSFDETWLYPGIGCLTDGVNMTSFDSISRAYSCREKRSKRYGA